MKHQVEKPHCSPSFRHYIEWDGWVGDGLNSTPRAQDASGTSGLSGLSGISGTSGTSGFAESRL